MANCDYYEVPRVSKSVSAGKTKKAFISTAKLTMKKYFAIILYTAPRLVSTSRGFCLEIK
jgi:hypothetical protein